MNKELTISGFFKNLINTGQDRSIRAKKNIIASFMIKGMGITINLILVPITINYINPSRYGIWLTLSSVIAWFSFFDVGLTQGLRNKFAEAKTKGEHDLAQVYVSTTYAMLAIIFTAVWIIFLIANSFFNWSNILNVSKYLQSEISILAVIVFTYFCLQFILRIITTLIIADQQPAKSSLIDLLGQVFSLIFIIILVKTTEGSLINLGLGLCVSPILVLICANIFFFKGALKRYRPVISKIKFTHAKSLFNLGIIFFVIQIAAVIQYETASIIIAKNFGTLEVTNYNIVYKYFGVLNMIFIIFLTPFWSASTEAYLKKDIKWIRNAVRKYNRLNVLMLAMGCVMLIFSPQIYALWLGNGTLNISFTLSSWGFLYFMISMFGSTYVFFLNGINALRIQFLASTISPLVYIAVTLILIKNYKMDTHALFVASIVANFNGLILAPLQYYKIIHQNKKGIWVK